MTPTEVLDRFTDRELVRLIAYQNLYGPIGPERLDLVAARLGMDVVAPHMKKGKRPKLKDHLIPWSRKAKRKTGRQILDTIRGIQAAFDSKPEED
jgi:hypothetical protein